MSAPPLPQWHVKDPGHSAKRAGGKLHLNSHTPWTQRSRSGLTATVQAWCGNLSGNKLTCNSSGNTWSQSSQLAEPQWADPGLKSGISVCKLISTLKKSAGGEWIVEHSPKILACEEKATTTTILIKAWTSVHCFKELVHFWASVYSVGLNMTWENNSNTQE